MWLCPAGIREDFIRVEDQIQECLHIFLPGKPFDDTLLKDLDIDPSGISIRYESIDHDTFIDYVADQILKELAAESSTGRLLIESLSSALSAHLVHSYSATARSAEAQQCWSQATGPETAVAGDGVHRGVASSVISPSRI